MSKKKFGIGPAQRETLRSVFIEYSDHLDEHGYVSITRWGNGEGFDVDVCSGGGNGGCENRFCLTLTQWKALRKAMRALNEMPEPIPRLKLHDR